MSYYSKKYKNYFDFEWKVIFFLICVMFSLMFMTNACSASKWNGGICPDCEIRYELGGVYRGLKYYFCPECGLEVERY